MLLTFSEVHFRRKGILQIHKLQYWNIHLTLRTFSDPEIGNIEDKDKLKTMYEDASDEGDSEDEEFEENES